MCSSSLRDTTAGRRSHVGRGRSAEKCKSSLIHFPSLLVIYPLVCFVLLGLCHGTHAHARSNKQPCNKQVAISDVMSLVESTFCLWSKKKEREQSFRECFLRSLVIHLLSLSWILFQVNIWLHLLKEELKARQNKIAHHGFFFSFQKYSSTKELFSNHK